MVARRGVSALRRWAEKHVIVGDGPRAGKRWKPGGPTWAEVLDAMDDRTLEQVTLRGSVQSGKTASLLVAALDVPGKRPAGIGITAAGVTVEWQDALALFDGHDPEVLMVSALDGNGRVACVDRFALPSPNSSDAATIAAQERRLLQTLLNSRERVAGAGGVVRADGGEGIGHELIDLAALDRRVAEVRARIVWYETAAGGNALPRAEYW